MWENRMPQFYTEGIALVLKNDRNFTERYRMNLMSQITTKCGHPYGEVCVYKIVNGVNNYTDLRKVKNNQELR